MPAWVPPSVPEATQARPACDTQRDTPLQHPSHPGALAYHDRICTGEQAVAYKAYPRVLGAYLVTHAEPDSLFKHLCDPSLDIFSRLLGRKNDLAMLLRRQLYRQPTRKGLVWLLPALGTKREIILDRIFECLAQLSYRLPLKCDDIPDVNHLTVKKIGLIIELDTGQIGTLDPRPSLISAPHARSKLSISAQGILARTGFSKMARNV